MNAMLPSAPRLESTVTQTIADSRAPYGDPLPASDVTDPMAVAKAMTPKSKAFHIPSLDGIRAMSFALVFVAHLGYDHVIPGGFGVTVFFFLSGFLITTLLRLEYTESGSINLRHFYLRRALRILPPFYLVLLMAYLIHASGLHEQRLQVGALVSQLTHWFNYWVVASPDAFSTGCAEGTAVYWSLAVEEHFYFIFPFVFLGLQRWFACQWRRQGVVLLGLCFVPMLWRVYLLAHGASSDRVYYATDTRADSILFGCALALLANPALTSGSSYATRRWRRIFFPLAVATLLFSFGYRATWFRDSVRYTVQGLALMPIFVVAIRDAQWGPMRLLNRRFVRWVGVLSYSLYLVHDVVLDAVGTLTPLRRMLLGAVSLAISIAFAAFIARWIEKPAARLRARYTPLRAKPAAVLKSASAQLAPPPGLEPGCAV